MKKKRDKNGRPVPTVPRLDVPLQVFIENVPEEDFRDALEQAPDPKFQNFLLARLSPEHKTTTFAHLCHLFNISLQDVHELWRHHQLHRAMIRMSNHLPKVLDDVGYDAESHFEYCTRCDGLGTVTEEGSLDPPVGGGKRGEGQRRLCPMCKGKTEVRIPGDRAARDLLFESIGLTGKRASLINIQQNFGLDAELGDVLETSQRVIQGSRE